MDQAKVPSIGLIPIEIDIFFPNDRVLLALLIRSERSESHFGSHV